MSTPFNYQGCCVAEPDQSTSPVQDMASNNQGTERDYDFVEEPDQDFYCPVSLEILLEPHQTLCCGHHISQQAANRLVRGGKHCPMCKKDNLATHEDKFLKRSIINKLKVRCPHKKSGCDWVGELGDLNLHSTSCPKRLRKCKHCDFESTYEVGVNNHTPNCTKYPQPCPNQCEIGSVPRYDLEKHLLVCPLQLVECEFAHSGCDVKVPQRDLTKHMTESAQHHLMSATLLNLRLTRELHQKMEEKDQQIFDLQQQQVKQLDADLKSKLQQQTRFLEQQTTQLDDKLNIRMCCLNKMIMYTSQGFSCHNFTLTESKKHQAKGASGCWYSEPFYNSTGGHKFKLNIDTNGHGVARGTHLSAHLCLQSGDDKELKWPIKVTVHLEMINQQGDHGHHMLVTTTEATDMENTKLIGKKFFPLAELGYSVSMNTEYLKDDSIHFNIYLKLV